MSEEAAQAPERRDNQGDLSGHFNAFISYNHDDRDAAQKLHKQLETYRLPKRVAQMVDVEGSGGRLGKIFRDREDLPAASDLSESVKAALSQSNALLVICSPSAKKSEWVTREIELFRELHPDRPILAALIRGEPDESFPTALAHGKEPLAADFRKEADGWRLAFLKIVAGLASVPLDALIQRDAQRRIRRVMLVTFFSLLLMVAMIGMTIFAFRAQAEAERQQDEAEGLIDYMLTDLRTGLKKVGRIDIMKGVNERAMAYYGSQSGLSELSSESLIRRADILKKMADDDYHQREYGKSKTKLREAARITEALLASASDNPEYIYKHADSQNSLSQNASTRKKWGEALTHNVKSKKLINKLAYGYEANPNWLELSGYIYGHGCTVAMRGTLDYKTALADCKAGLDSIGRLNKLDPENAEYTSALINRHAWLSQAYFLNEMKEEGTYHRLVTLKKVLLLSKSEPENMRFTDQLMRTHMVVAEMYFEQGNKEAGQEQAEKAQTLAIRLVNHDPSNKRWLTWKKRITKLVNQ